MLRLLPSATDSMGNLVNYIEVSPDAQQTLPPSSETQQQADNALRPPHDLLDTNSMASVQTAATNDDDMEPIHRTSGNHDTQQQTLIRTLRLLKIPLIASHMITPVELLV